MREIDLIVIHCSATPNGRPHTVEDIDRWHRERGFRRGAQGLQKQNPSLPSVGYHFVIYTNGALVTGRHPQEVGAHAVEQAANRRGLGLCMVGTDKFSAEQWAQLREQVLFLQKKYSIQNQFASVENDFVGVCGHRDLGARKACPGFDVRGWLSRGMLPLSEQILEQQ